MNAESDWWFTKFPLREAVSAAASVQGQGWNGFPRGLGDHDFTTQDVARSSQLWHRSDIVCAVWSPSHPMRRPPQSRSLAPLIDPEPAYGLAINA